MLKQLIRPGVLAAGVAASATLLGGCYAPPMYQHGHYMPPFQPPMGQYPGYVSPPVFMEFGHVVNIETFEGQTSGGGTTGIGTVAGGLIGGVLGNQIGRGSGRAAATALGAVGGAVAGNVLEARTHGPRPFRVTRITVQTDMGVFRVFDVPDPGDLRIGHRVRIENGQLSRA